MSDIRFSIIVPVYNVEKYIDSCINSVLNQSYQNYEVLLVDDGSVDSSGKICDTYASKYEKISSFHKENAGQLHTREYGIKRAVGDFCVFLDSDDTLVSDALEVIAETIDTYQCDCVVYNWRRVLNGEYLDPFPTGDIYVAEDKHSIYKKIFSNFKYNSMCIKAIKTSAFREIDYSFYYSIRHGEDLIHSLDALKQCTKVVFIPNALYNYTVNSQSVTHTVSYEKFKINFTVREKVLDFIKSENVFTEDDYEEYRQTCINILFSTLSTISSFKTSYKNKKNLFDDIHNSHYFTSFLNASRYKKKLAGVKGKIFILFTKKRYRMVLFCFRVKRLFRK